MGSRRQRVDLAELLGPGLPHHLVGYAAHLHGGGDPGGRSFRPVFQPWQALVEHGESILAVQDQELPAAHLGDEQSTVVQDRQPAGRRQGI